MWVRYLISELSLHFRGCACPGRFQQEKKRLCLCALMSFREYKSIPGKLKHKSAASSRNEFTLAGLCMPLDGSRVPTTCTKIKNVFIWFHVFSRTKIHSKSIPGDTIYSREKYPFPGQTKIWLQCIPGLNSHFLDCACLLTVSEVQLQK